MAVAGGKVKSLKRLKDSLKKSSGGGRLISRIPAESGIIVRFMEEPEEWYEFFTHFDNAKQKGGICTGDDCSWCDNGIRKSKRYLAPAVDIGEGSKVIALEIPLTAMKVLTKRYERYGTMLDRDYEIIKTGTGLETEYDVEVGDVRKMSLSKFDRPDLEEILEQQAAADNPSDDDDDESEDDEDTRRPAKRTPVKKPRRRTSVDDMDDDEDEEDDEEGDEDEDDEPPARRRPAKKIVKKSSASPTRRVIKRR